MQSTSVYWIGVYDILEASGLDVYLVNGRDTKNLPGRKSDVQESQWLMKLHTYGLLRNSFRPSQKIRTDAHVLAAAQWSHTGSRLAHPADTESADADEYPAGQCIERCQRGDRTGHPQSRKVMSFQQQMAECDRQLEHYLQLEGGWEPRAKELVCPRRCGRDDL
jgi:hypothetical protein